VKWYYLAIGVYERLLGRLSPKTETRDAFRTRTREAYLELVRLLVELGRLDEAFAVLERSRAQGFLALLSTRELSFATDLPSAVEDTRTRLNREHDSVQRKLWSLDPDHDASEREAVLSRLLELRDEQSRLAETIRRASPRFAAHQYPARWTAMAPAARWTRGPCSQLRGRSAPEPPFRPHRDEPLQVVPIAAGAAAEGGGREVPPIDRVDRAGPATGGDGRPGSRALRSLMRPVGDIVERGQRLLIVPDGPLHLLPFSALVVDGSEQRRGRCAAALLV
jgi:hypothetical protein